MSGDLPPAGPGAGAGAVPAEQRGPAAAAAAVAVAASAVDPAHAPPAAAAPHPDGISLAGLRAFVAEHGGAEGLAGKTTSDVKWAIVVPETKAAARSYADLLRARGGTDAACVGRASAFVSHVYTYKFLDVVEAIAAWEARQLTGGAAPRRELHEHALEAALLSNRGCDVCRRVIVREATWHPCAACGYDECADCFAESERLAASPPEAAADPAAEAPPPVFYYFDLLVVNQHGQSAAVAPEVLWREFTGGVRAIGRTLLVLTLDASQRGPLTRAWCVAEIAAGLQGDDSGSSGGGAAGGSFEVIVTPAEEARFIRELTGDFENVVQRTCTVDLARCHAYHGDECLVDGVCRDVAVGRVAACSDDLRIVLDNVRRELPLEEASKRVIQRMNESMVGIARMALAAFPDGFERKGSDLQFYLASFLHSCGRLAEAEALLRETAELWRRVRGTEAMGTLAATGMLASVLQDEGKFDEAELLMRETLAAERRTLGDAHPSTLTSMNNLGVLLKVRGNLGGAKQLLHEALDAQRRTLGDTHPSTLISISNVGVLLKDRGDIDGAEQLYRQALDARRRMLGDTHPSTLTSINNLGMLLDDIGDMVGAESLFREALDARRRTLGDAHPETLTSISNLGEFLYKRGDLDGAEKLLREALPASRRTLGDAHPDTLTSISSLGMLLVARSNKAGAEPLLRGALGAPRQTPRLLNFNRNNISEAALLLREALEGFRRMLGDAHENTRVISLWLAGTLRAQGDEAGAAAAEALVA